MDINSKPINQIIRIKCSKEYYSRLCVYYIWHQLRPSEMSETAMYTLGIQIRNMKMVFNIYGTWRWVAFEKLMMKIHDFFYSAKSFGHPI